jgi:energy-coupling factor transport system ATP-binding protein
MGGYTIENLTFTYPERMNPALDNINLTVRQGEFMALCGKSGCGKTTLLRQLKPSLAPHGVKTGRILFDGVPLDGLSHRDASAKIGFVMQSPENQIVTDKVWHELAFGLESLGYTTPEIRLKVAEMASFFGIQTWFYKNVTELSGGQKQLLALASVMALQPSVLILDEPTSRLDPIAASEFLATVGKINRELGVTVILTEHRLEEIFPFCDRVAVMDNGKIAADDSPRMVGLQLRERGSGMFLAMPVAMRVWIALSGGVYRFDEVPVTVRDGREWLNQYVDKNNIDITAVDSNDKISNSSETPAVELSEVWFKYAKDLPDVVKGASFRAYSGEITAILGGNGTGKTSMLSLIPGINKPYRGKIKLNGEEFDKIPENKLFDKLLGVLPQNPQTLFVGKTVVEDLLEILSGMKISKQEKLEKVYKMAELCEISGLMKSHPYDLSGGEQQRAALAKVLLLQPRILLLDEPTKGFDAEFKAVFAGILRRLTAAGVCVVMVSHDIEFCAQYADRCALFFDGNIVTAGRPREFFSGNSFYTSGANRMARHIIPDAVTANDIISALGGGTEKTNEVKEPEKLLYSIEDTTVKKVIDNPAKLPLKRKIIAAISSGVMLATLVFAAVNIKGLTDFISGGDIAVTAASDPVMVWRYVGIILMFAAEAAVLVLAISYKRGTPQFTVQAAPDKRKLSKRTLAAAVMILLAIPVTIYTGSYFLGDRKYYFVSLLIILETMLPFALVFESRKPQARELVIISVMCAVGVAGRAAFFMLPQFKPVVAVVIIAGVAFGGEAGFLVGAMTGFVSNMFFGQGPWTPWQMFSFGIIGFIAGVLFRKGILRRNRAALCVYGGLSALFVYGILMDSSMVLINQPQPTGAMFFAAWLQGIPFNLVHALATVVFLAVISQPLLEKLDRIKVKYGLY